MQEKQSIDNFLAMKKVYYVESPTDETVLVAIHPQYSTETQSLTWWDTVKERIKLVKAIEIVGEVLQVTDASDTRYVFHPMTLAIYNERVKDQLIEGRAFNTEEDLTKAFENTII